MGVGLWVSKAQVRKFLLKLLSHRQRPLYSVAVPQAILLAILPQKQESGRKEAEIKGIIGY